MLPPALPSAAPAEGFTARLEARETARCSTLSLSELIFARKVSIAQTSTRRRCRFRLCFRSRPAAAPRTAFTCPQSAHYETGISADKLMPLDTVLAEARTRGERAGFCKGAAWRSPKNTYVPPAIHVCCVGMGEEREYRIGMVATLANLPEHSESVAINMLARRHTA